MPGKTVYVEVVERGDAGHLFVGYVDNTTNCFYDLQDLIDFLIDHEVTDCDQIWDYLEGWAEELA